MTHADPITCPACGQSIRADLVDHKCVLRLVSDNNSPVAGESRAEGKKATYHTYHLRSVK